MPQYFISGVWKDANNIIISYAFHIVNKNVTSKATKMSKAEAINLLDNPVNEAITIMWDYTTSNWKLGEKVEVIQGAKSKYLRSDPDNRLTDNLAHLIDYDWIKL